MSMSLLNEVQKFIEAHPGCTSGDIADAFAGYSRQRVLQSASKLRQSGRVAHRCEGDISALVICIIVCLSWAVNHYRDNAIAYKEQRDKKVRELKQATATITDMQQRQRSADALDAKYTKELADAKAENDALRRKLDNGGRVFVKGKCPVPSSAETSSASGMGNDATVELSPVAGRNVLGIRDGIIRDQTALRTLQEYIRTQCLR